MGGKGGEGWGELLPTNSCRSLAFDAYSMHLPKGLVRGLRVSELGGVMCMRMVIEGTFSPNPRGDPPLGSSRTSWSLGSSSQLELRRLPRLSSRVASPRGAREASTGEGQGHIKSCAHPVMELHPLIFGEPDGGSKFLSSSLSRRAREELLPLLGTHLVLHFFLGEGKG